MTVLPDILSQKWLNNFLCPFRIENMIREANEEDCISLAGLSLDVWFNTYALDGINTAYSKYAISTFTEQNFIKMIRDSKYRILVNTEEIYLRGYALINLESFYAVAENGFEIDKLYVHGPFQGKGIGKGLLSEVERRYGEQFWLHTWVHNKSIGFYKKYGFKEIGRYVFMLGEEKIQNCVLCYSRT